MCFNCPDFVDYCDRDGCYNSNGGRYNRFRKFYIGDKYCEHLRRTYGHDIATLKDQSVDSSAPA